MVYTCNETWRPCFLHVGINFQVYTISWCQKWNTFEKTLRKCTWSPSSKHHGTLCQFIRDFKVLIFDPLDSITAIFKFQISSLRIHIQPAVYPILLYRHECFTGKYTTRKIHKNYIRDPSGLFSIISQVSLSMISLISRLPLKLYLNSLVYHRNIFGSSSKVFGNLRKSLDIFGNFRKFSDNVRERSSALRNNFGKFSDIFGRWSEIFGKSSKTPFPGDQYHIELVDNPTPVVQPLRTVYVHILPLYKAELEKMITDGIITEVTEPTDWINSIVCNIKETPDGKKKSGCAWTPKTWIRTSAVRTVDEILLSLYGKNYFSVVDTTKGYWHVDLHHSLWSIQA